MKTVVKGLIAALLFVGSVAHANTILGPELRDELTKEMGPAAIQKVMKDSLNIKSEIGKIIAKNDIVDGRNNNGQINLPLSPKDIKITLIDGEDQYGVYCQENTCGNGKYAVFLISIASYMGVHKAAGFSAVSFLVKVELSNSYPKTEDGWDDSKKETTVEAKFMKEIQFDIYSAE
jgi:hypothetical protein